MKNTDLLIIGSGIAGLTAAIAAADKNIKCIVISKNEISDCNTRHAQGGVAAVLSPNDTIESHIADTLNTGGGICNEEAVSILAENGADEIKKIIAMGASFTTNLASDAFAHLDLGREGGHNANRIVHCRDQTGLEIENTLLNIAENHKNITILQYHTLIELITAHNLVEKDAKERKFDAARCFGAYILDRNAGKIFSIRAKNTILATGGIGAVYQHSTNPSCATGDGIAAAHRAGCLVSNLEFIQFHPTTLFHPQAQSFLISEALRGFGAVLKTKNGEEFMQKYHPMLSLAPRDVVARAIDKEMKLSGEDCMYLDIRHADSRQLLEHFPLIFAHCLKFGIDISTDMIPVVPAFHYCCGGIAVDLDGKTTLDNLFAVGECANTGVHGANRLASNSLLEAMVFGRRAAEKIAAENDKTTLISPKSIKKWDDSGTVFADEWVLVSHDLDEIKKIMWNFVGIVRNNKRLERALRRITLIRAEIEQFYKETKVCTPVLELRNIACVAELVIRSAIYRKESRGLHYTTDYPDRSEAFCRDTII